MKQAGVYRVVLTRGQKIPSAERRLFKARFGKFPTARDGYVSTIAPDSHFSGLVFDESRKEFALMVRGRIRDRKNRARGHVYALRMGLPAAVIGWLDLKFINSGEACLILGCTRQQLPAI